MGVEIRSLDGSPTCSSHTFTVHLSFKLFIEMGTTLPISDLHFQAKNSGGLPWWSVVKNPPASAEDRFDPWSGKIPRAKEQLSPRATTTEPVL